MRHSVKKEEARGFGSHFLVGLKLKLFSPKQKQRHEKTGCNKGMGKFKMRNADCPNHQNEIIFAVYPIESSGLVYK